MNKTFRIIAVILGVIVFGVLGVYLWLRPPDFITTITDPGPTLPPDAVDTGGGVFYETDFSSAEVAANWEIYDDGFISTRIETENNGALIFSADDAIDIGGWSGLNQTFSDFELTTEARLLEGRPADSQILIVFRLTDTENYYRFDITLDGLYALTEVTDGQPRVVSDFHFSPAINTDELPNSITIQAVGDRFTFRVNGSDRLPLCVADDPTVQPLWEAPRDPASACLGGEIVTMWQDDSLPTGKIGLGAQGIQGFDEDFNPLPAQATVAFDSVQITQPAE